MKSLYRNVICAIGGILPMTSSHLMAEGTEKRGPLNVLFITIDDMNIWPGEFDGMAITPHIDSLANVATKFTNAHCVVPASNCTLQIYTPHFYVI